MGGNAARTLLSVILLIAVGWYFFLSNDLQLVENFNRVPFKVSDTYAYEQAADWLYGGERISPTRPPGYPIIIGAIQTFITDIVIQDAVLLALQTWMWLLTIVMLYLVINSFAGHWRASIASFIYIICISPIIYTAQLLSETTFVFVCMAALWAWSKGVKGNAAWKMMALFLLSYSALVKPFMIYPGVLLLIILVITAIKRQKWKLVVTYPLAFLSLIIASSIPMKQQYDTFSLSIIGPQTISGFYCQKVHSNADNVPLEHYVDEWRVSVQLPPPSHPSFAEKVIEANAFYSRNIKSTLSEHPFWSMLTILQLIEKNGRQKNSLILDLEDCRNEGGLADKVSLYRKIGKAQSQVFFYGFLAASLFLIWRLKDREGLGRKPIYQIIFFAALIAISCYGISGFSFWQGDRFVVIAFPFVLVMASLLLQKKNVINQQG